MARLLVAVIFALAVASAQATLVDDIEYDIDQVENVFKNAFDDMVYDIEYVVGRLKEFLKSLLENNRAQLIEIADFAKDQVDKDDSLDEKCKEEVKQKIENHKTSSVANFFTCSNLTDALVETGSIMVLSLELTANVTENFNAIFYRLAACSKKNIFERPICWLSAITAVSSDIKKDMDDIAFFKQRVFKLSHDIGANVDYCIHPPKKNLTEAVEHAIQSSKDCHKTNPVKITTLH